MFQNIQEWTTALVFIFVFLFVLVDKQAIRLGHHIGLEVIMMSILSRVRCNQQVFLLWLLSLRNEFHSFRPSQLKYKHVHNLTLMDCSDSAAWPLFFSSVTEDNVSMNGWEEGTKKLIKKSSLLFCFHCLVVSSISLCAGNHVQESPLENDGQIVINRNQFLYFYVDPFSATHWTFKTTAMSEAIAKKSTYTCHKRCPPTFSNERPNIFYALLLVL